MRALFRRLAGAAAVVVASVVAPPALAAPKDAQADKAYKQAMEDDYLDSKFDDAKSVLDKAIDACGDAGCSTKVKAHLLMGRASVLGIGKKKLDQAKDSFVQALKLDPSATPDPDYMNDDLKTAFADAQKIAKKGGGTPPPSSGNDTGGGTGLDHAVPEEQKVNTPLPLYVGVGDDIAKKVASVVVTYVATNGGDAQEVTLEKSGKGFRGNVPCAATKKKGKLKYWVTAKDKNDKVVASVGTEDAPNETTIKASLDDKPPSWPGFAPPDSCGGGGSEMSDADIRAKSSLRQCIDNGDCPPTEKCSQNTCLLKPTDADAGSSDTGDTGDSSAPTDPTKEKKRRFWFSLTFQPDIDVVSGSEICTKNGQTTQNFVCLRPPGTGGVRDAGGNPALSAYTGTPTANQGDDITGGVGFGQARLLAGFDAVIVDNFSLGLRIGYAFNGSPAPASFIPAHVEAHAEYAFGSRAYTGAIARPFVKLGGGFGQFDVETDVPVAEDGVVCGATDPKSFKSDCAAGYGKAGGAKGVTRVQTLEAIKQAGLGFIDVGGGVSILPAKMFAINIGFAFTATVPVFMPVLSPDLGIALGF